MPELEPTYRQRLKKLSRVPGILPEVAFFNTQVGVLKAAQVMDRGFPIVPSFGATYGVAFPLTIREEIAQARKEVKNVAGQLDAVSLVTTHDLVIQEWLDYERLHPQLIEPIKNGSLRIFENVAFLQFPPTEIAENYLGLFGPYFINSQNRVQVFSVPEQDLLLNMLENQFGLPVYAVRSSNIHGELEATTAKNAFYFAGQIAAPIFTIPSIKKTQSESQRLRVGSQPILLLPEKDEELAITILRAGNTGIATLTKFIKCIFGENMQVKVAEIKAAPTGRKTFNVDSRIIKPQGIKDQLLKASGL